MNETDSTSWESARLIPVSGIGSAKEEERRATSALLAVLVAVDEFAVAITKPYGAFKGKFESFIEVPFEHADGRTVRPDGLIRSTFGKRTWTALVEVKTRANELGRDQVETYLDIARKEGFDCVITISNQIARIPGQHPIEVEKKKLKNVSLYHMSWSRIITEAILLKTHKGVADQDQAWILGELIRYLEHPNAGAVDFADMGEHWVAVRDSVKHGTLRHPDKKAIEVAGKWEELITFASLRLGRKLGTDVHEVLSSKEKQDISHRIDNIVNEMVARRVMTGTIRIPNTAGDISIVADLHGRQVVTSLTLGAPKTGQPTTRINWLLRQLKSSSADVRLDSRAKYSKWSPSDLLSNVQKDPSLLIPADNKEILSFTVSLTRPMGAKRAAGKGAFIDSVLDTLDEFYGDVVQQLKEWQPPAPKFKERGSNEPEESAPPIPIAHEKSITEFPAKPLGSESGVDRQKAEENREVQRPVHDQQPTPSIESNIDGQSDVAVQKAGNVNQHKKPEPRSTESIN